MLKTETHYSPHIQLILDDCLARLKQVAGLSPRFVTDINKLVVDGRMGSAAAIQKILEEVEDVANPYDSN
ncbi:MAG: hypothetical protein AAF485_31810 [Chloroflexota bacterium]